MKDKKKTSRLTGRLLRQPKEEVINVRMTKQQKESLDAAAAGEGLGLSTWLLRLGLMAAQEKVR